LKKIVLLLLLILLLLSGCATMSDIVDKKTAEKIPQKSDTVRFIKKADVKELFDKIFKKLSKKGWVITSKNIIDNFASIATEGKKIEYDTLLKLKIIIEKKNDHFCSVDLNGEWKAGSRSTNMASFWTGVKVTHDFSRVVWENKAHKTDVAFIKMVDIAKSFKPQDIKYIISE